MLFRFQRASLSLRGTHLHIQIRLLIVLFFKSESFAWANLYPVLPWKYSLQERVFPSGCVDNRIFLGLLGVPRNALMALLLIKNI